MKIPEQKTSRSNGPVIAWPGEGHQVGNVESLARTTDTPRFNFGIIEMSPERGLEQHVHEDEDGSFYILDGEMTFYVGEGRYKAGPGSFIFGPKDVPHTYTVDSGPAKLLFVLSPAGFEGFIEAVSEPAKARTLPPPQPETPPAEAAPEEAEIEDFDFAALEARYGCEILGPPPGQ